MLITPDHTACHTETAVFPAIRFYSDLLLCSLGRPQTNLWCAPVNRAAAAGPGHPLLHSEGKESSLTLLSLRDEEEFEEYGE